MQERDRALSLSLQDLQPGEAEGICCEPRQGRRSPVCKALETSYDNFAFHF